MTPGLPVFALICILASLPLYGNWWGVAGVVGLLVMLATPAVGRR